MLSFFPRGVLDEILNLIESVSEDFPSYSFINLCSSFPFSFDGGLWNLNVLIPDHCLSIYFSCLSDLASSPWTFRVHLASTGFLHTCWGKMTPVSLFSIRGASLVPT